MKSGLILKKKGFLRGNNFIERIKSAARWIK